MKKRKKVYSIVSLVMLVLFLSAGSVFLFRFIRDFNANPEAFKQAVDAYGLGNNAVILVALQIVQIVFPILPGEVIEVAVGYVFGPFLGLLLCEVGILLASVPIFFASRAFGKRIIASLFSGEKIRSLSFLQNEKRIALVLFLLFFLPGTPKDLLTYFVGLTPVRPLHFVLITVFARIPSILTSTFAGASMGGGQPFRAAILYAITAGISLVGLIVYTVYTKRRASALP